MKTDIMDEAADSHSEKEWCRFKPGEIVEVLYGNQEKLAVIDGGVRFVKDMWLRSIERRKKSSGILDGGVELTDDDIDFYDSSDDTVWIIFGPRYFCGDDDWVHILNIMPLRYPLSDKIRAQYEGWYKSMMEESRKD